MLTLGNKLTLNSQPIYKFVNEHSIDFDGVDDRIITDGADTIAQNTTYSFWCKATETGANKGVFGHGGDNQGAFHFNWSSGRPFLRLGETYYRFWVANDEQDDGEWHHWVVYADTNDITNSKLYVDGVLQTVDSTTTSGSLNAYAQSLTIGSDRQVGGNSFEGKIDEFAVYDRELTQAEITRMYNTYYSPNRVANGNFAQIGNEEVTNGDFSQIGSELVTNGDFATDSDWTLDTGWSINQANNVAVSDGTNNADILQSGSVVGKFYKATFTIPENNAGRLSVYIGGVYVGNTGTGNTGDFTFYGQASDTTLIRFRAALDFDGTLTNISVKEVGQDWTVTGTDSTHYVEFLSTGARYVSDTTSPLLELKQNAITSGKQYVMTCNVAYTGEGAIRLNVGSNLTAFAEGANTKYFTASSNTMSFLRDASNVDCVISNVSVKEVGQHWTVGSSDADNYVVFNGSTARLKLLNTSPVTTLTGSFLMTAGSTYKLIVDVASVTSGSIKIDGAGISELFNSAGVTTRTITPTVNTGLTFYRASADVDITLNSVILQELNHDATNLMLNAGAYQSANPLITSTKSMEFDGTDNYITVADNSSLDFAAGFSVSFWLYPQAADSNDRMICKGLTGTGEWMISFGAAQAVRVYTKDGDDVVKDFTSANTLTLNEWAMVTVVINRTTNYLQVYKNGGNLSEISASWTSGWSNSAALTMGVNSSLVRDFDGRMTEVGIWDRELTSLEVASLYNQGMPTNLLVNRNNYQSGNPTVFNTKQVDFDGADDYLKANSTLGSFTGSISAWIKRDTTNNWTYIVDFRENSGGGYLNINPSGIISTNGSSVKYVDNVVTSQLPQDTEWHHVVITNLSINITECIFFGARFSQAEELNGKMSQVGLWNSTLTADEVSSLYNHGLPIDLTTNQAAYESSSNLVGYWRMGSGTLDSYPLIADQTNATLSSELVTCGDFSCANPASVWTIGNGWSLGTNKIESVNGANYATYQEILTSGKMYKISYEVKDYQSGLFGIRAHTGGMSTATANGNYTVYLTSDGIRLYLMGFNNFNGSVTNISVKEVGGNPAIMTNQTSSDIENGSPYANIVQNGTFATDSDWTKGAGWTIANGIASQSGGVGQLYQTINTTVGVDCKITFTANVTAGAIRIAAGPGAAIADFTSGTHTLIVPFLGNTILYILGSSSSFVGSIDNVTVEEVNTGLQGYWKMGDGTNDEYPVIYDQTNPTNGSDLVINGDFATDSDWTKAANWTISGGKAISNGSGLIYQTGVTYLDDKQYKVTFNADITSGGFTVRIGNTSSSVAVTQGLNTHYLSRIPSNTTGYLFFQANSGVGSIDNVSVKEVQGNPSVMTNMVEGNITNQYPLTKIRNYYRMGDGILDGYPIIQDQTSPNLAHIPTTNLYDFSEDFSSWSYLPRYSLSYGFLSPDGTNNATKLTAANPDPYIFKNITGATALTYSASIYIKGTTSTIGEDARLWIIRDNVDFPFQDFTITGEWQRIKFTTSFGTTPTSYVYLRLDAPNTNVQVGDEVFIFGAQLEEQSQATAYLKSDGIAAVRKSSTTNLITYSEDFTQSYWTKFATNLTITPNAIASPTGFTNASKLVSGSTDTQQAIYKSITQADCTLSVYAKKAEFDTVALKLSGSQVSEFNLSNGTIGFNANVIPSIENVGNGWYRCSITITSGSSVYAWIAISSGNTQGDQTSGIYIWGSQLEVQTQAETYAKTTGLPVTIDLFTENNYGTMTNMSASDIIEDTP